MRAGYRLVLLLAAAGLGAQAELPEYVLKAGFLFNFAKYVEWPEGAFREPGSPLVIGVVGRDPFGKDLDRTLEGKTVKGRPIRVVRFRSPEDIRDVHILFVPSSEEHRIEAVLRQVRSKPTLLVGEGPRFCREGGTLNILLQDGQPKLQANPDAAARANLTIDAKLLRASTIVRGGS